jgi:hypothetical protein
MPIRPLGGGIGGVFGGSKLGGISASRFNNPRIPQIGEKGVLRVSRSQLHDTYEELIRVHYEHGQDRWFTVGTDDSVTEWPRNPIEIRNEEYYRKHEETKKLEMSGMEELKAIIHNWCGKIA